MKTKQFDYDVAVIGGCGHVGLPLALVFADKLDRVLIYDINSSSVGMVRSGRMPFKEDGGDDLLARTLERGSLECTDDPSQLARAKYLVTVVGTPVDEHLNPAIQAIFRALEPCLRHFRSGQVLILRSTVFPGTSEKVRDWLRDKGIDISVTFCPERVAQGVSIREISELPQIVSAFEDDALAQVTALFRSIGAEIVVMSPEEAEVAKLITNAWRYIQFAAVNQFYTMATARGLDFARILQGSKHHYPRLAGIPGPGLAAGPCLFKDTMQLAAFSGNQFFLGHAAMLVNEGLPAHLVALAKARTPLRDKTAGILGMAFKSGSDDARSSLSYKLKKLLQFEAKRVVCTDPHVDDAELSSLDDVVRDADVLFVATPHAEYRRLALPQGVIVIDVWDFVDGGRTGK